MTKDRINKAVEIIEYAMKNNISVAQASIKNGFTRTYIKNIKSQVNEKYENGSIGDDLYDTFQSSYDQYLNTNNSNSNEKPNINIGVEGDFKEFGNTNVNENIENTKTSIKETDSHSEITYSGGKIRNVDDLLDTMGVDRTLWEVKSKIVNSWNTTAFSSIDGIKVPVVHTNFQVKARLEKIKEEADARNFAEIFKNLAENYSPPAIDSSAIPTFNGESNPENNLLEISLFDLHIGKLGWAGEVGENYDTKIARARFLDAVTKLLSRAKGFTYNKILFPIGNDFFNSDNQFNTTTKGTPQDEDLRWQKTYDLGCQLIIDAIMLLKATGVPVEVPIIPGNHDQERSYYLGSFVDAWFRNDDQVNVNNSAKTRKFYEWGQVMLGFTHGNEEKEASLPLLMASEEKQMWGRTSFHEWHLGHFHKKRNVKFTVLDKAQMLNEELGVTVRYLSSLSGTEEWHYKKGYIGTQKAGEAFIWNDKSGMVGHLNFNFTDFDREK